MKRQKQKAKMEKVPKWSWKKEKLVSFLERNRYLIVSVAVGQVRTYKLEFKNDEDSDKRFEHPLGSYATLTGELKGFDGGSLSLVHLEDSKDYVKGSHHTAVVSDVHFGCIIRVRNMEREMWDADLRSTWGQW